MWSTMRRERESDVTLQSYHHSPDEVVEHGVVLTLPNTVVRMEMAMCFSQVMLLVEQRDDDGSPSPVSLVSSIR